MFASPNMTVDLASDYPFEIQVGFQDKIFDPTIVSVSARVVHLDDLGQLESSFALNALPCADGRSACVRAEKELVFGLDSYLTLLISPCDESKLAAYSRGLQTVCQPEGDYLSSQARVSVSEYYLDVAEREPAINIH